MLPRTVGRQAARFGASSSSAAPLRNARLFSAHVRPSAIALGKRPALGPLPLSPLARNFSWSPYKPSPPPVDPDAHASAAAAAPPTPALDPSLTSPHPDLVTPPPSEPIASPSAPLDSAAPLDPSSASASDASALLDAPRSLFEQYPNLNPSSTITDILRETGMSLADLRALPEVIHSPIPVSSLADVNLGHSFINIAGWASDAIVGLHNITGLPWWGTIALFTLSLRILLLRIQIPMQKHNLRMGAIGNEQRELMAEVQKARKEGDTETQAAAMSRVQLLWAQNDVHPARTVLMPMSQLPVFLSMFYGLKRLANNLPQLQDGGFAWVQDLTAPDPYWILPITSMICTNLIVRFGADGVGQDANPNPIAPHMVNLVGGLSIIGVFFVHSFPSVLLFYWCTTNIISLLWAFVTSRGPMRRWLGFPPKPEHQVKRANATLFETYHWARDGIKARFGEAGEEAARQAARKERMEGRRAGTAFMVTERVGGESTGGGGAGGAQGGFLESAAPAGEIVTAHRHAPVRARPVRPAPPPPPPPPPASHGKSSQKRR